jgi:hypothetical protein
MARYIMVLWGATSLQGALEGVGPENQDFFEPYMARPKRVTFGPKKVELCCYVLLCIVVCCCV